MKKYWPLIALVVIAIGIGVAIMLMSGDDEPEATTQQPATSSPTTPPNSTETTPPPTTTTGAVSMEGSAFTPANITVRVGTTITWTNNDNTLHDVVADSDGGPNSSNMQEGDTFSFKFENVGEFPYHCSYHPGMTGKVTVIE